MTAQERLRYQIGKCRNCEACRELVGISCVVFEKMFRLADRERETGRPTSDDDLRHLVDLCHLCGMCPCSDVRTAILNVKTALVSQYGLDCRVRTMADVDRVGRVGGAMPRLSNFILQGDWSGGFVRRAAGIHRDRKIPSFPKERFSDWLRRDRRGKNMSGPKRKVAYFVGCTARHLFPEVARSAVNLFERGGFEVFVPEQHCCGMPSLLEGDKTRAVALARFNASKLCEAVDHGYDIVCSCPTCGYMLKKMLVMGLEGRAALRKWAETVDDLAVPVEGGLIGSLSGIRKVKVPAKMIAGLLADDGYFSSIDLERRLRISENIYDMGEYLSLRVRKGELDLSFGPVSGKAAYFAPCHLREQRIGSPYLDLMGLVPGLEVEAIYGTYCCGNAGIMGFKNRSHPLSVRIGSPLMAKAKQMNPDMIATDCLSCRMQFQQLTPFKVLHPVEILQASQDAAVFDPVGKAV
jgi:glycerol-3-phosphate dehydrogenase subunit C